MVAVDMPRLNRVFRVLKHDLHVPSEVRRHHSGLEVIAASRVVLNASEAEDTRNLEVIGKFKWGVRWNEGYAIDGVSLFAVDHGCGVHESDRSSGVD